MLKKLLSWLNPMNWFKGLRSMLDMQVLEWAWDCTKYTALFMGVFYLIYGLVYLFIGGPAVMMAIWLFGWGWTVLWCAFCFPIFYVIGTFLMRKVDRMSDSVTAIMNEQARGFARSWQQNEGRMKDITPKA